MKRVLNQIRTILTGEQKRGILLLMFGTSFFVLALDILAVAERIARHWQ